MKAATATKKTEQRDPMTFTCKLTYPTGGHVKLKWDPKPAGFKKCIPGDTIKFESPDVPSVLSFGVDSPFEKEEGPKDYKINQGATLTRVVNKRFLKQPPQDFKFNCKPNGFAVPGSGGTVPVGNGGL
jgi:hypothetical protein